MSKRKKNSSGLTDRDADRLKLKVVDGVGILDRTEAPEGKCETCGKADELRPYGPKGEWICFDCGMANEATTKRMFAKHVFGTERH